MTREAHTYIMSSKLCILFTDFRCSRQHPRPPSSVTLLIPAMYTDIRHIESALDIADRDTGLEVRNVFEYTLLVAII